MVAMMSISSLSNGFFVEKSLSISISGARELINNFTCTRFASMKQYSMSSLFSHSSMSRSPPRPSIFMTSFSLESMYCTENSWSASVKVEGWSTQSSRRVSADTAGRRRSRMSSFFILCIWVLSYIKVAGFL